MGPAADTRLKKRLAGWAAATAALAAVLIAAAMPQKVAETRAAAETFPIAHVEPTESAPVSRIESLVLLKAANAEEGLLGAGSDSAAPSAQEPAPHAPESDRAGEFLAASAFGAAPALPDDQARPEARPSPRLKPFSTGVGSAFSIPAGRGAIGPSSPRARLGFSAGSSALAARASAAEARSSRASAAFEADPSSGLTMGEVSEAASKAAAPPPVGRNNRVFVMW